MHSYEAVACSTGARLILNTHNVEGPLARDLAMRERSPAAKLVRHRFAERVIEVESEVVRRANQTWVCSESDRRLVEREYGAAANRVYVVPNAIDTARYTARNACPAELAYGTGPKFLFTGVFHYPPNLEAARFLLRELFPRLRLRYADARLALVGADPPPALIQEAAAIAGVTLTGPVPDTLPYFQHAWVMLVPLFDGGGTRFKLLEAFAARLPVVSSAKGAEGLDVQDGRELLLSDTIDEFMQAIEQTLSNREATEIRVKNAASFVERYSWTGAKESVRAALDALRL
jgi:polysaccharide biosynthesis protein PslH